MVRFHPRPPLYEFLSSTAANLLKNGVVTLVRFNRFPADTRSLGEEHLLQPLPLV